MGKNLKQNLTFLILVLFSFCSLSAQIIIPDSSKGLIRIFASETPDSITLNGIRFNFINKKNTLIDTGKYSVVAFLDCHYPIKKEITIESWRLLPVSIKFKHFTTSEFQTYQWSNRINYSISALGFTGSLLYSAGLKFLAPISGIGLIGHFLWKKNQSKLFNLCTGKYFNPNYKKNVWRFSVGIASKVLGEYNFEIKEVFDEVYYIPSPVGIQRNLKKKVRVGSNDYLLSNYALTVGVEKYFYGNFLISSNFYVFPSMRMKYEFFDLPINRTDFEDPKEELHIKSMFYLSELDLGIRFYKGLNHEWIFMIGGYLSNTVKETKQFNVQTLQYQYFQENPVTTPIELSYKATGISTGVEAIYHFGNNFAFLMRYKVCLPQTMEINGMEDKRLFLNISSSIAFKI